MLQFRGEEQPVFAILFAGLVLPVDFPRAPANQQLPPAVEAVGGMGISRQVGNVDANLARRLEIVATQEAGGIAYFFSVPGAGRHH